MSTLGTERMRRLEEVAQGGVHGYDGFEHGRTLCGKAVEGLDVRGTDDEVTCLRCLEEGGADIYVHGYDRLGGDEHRTLCDKPAREFVKLTGFAVRITCPLCKEGLA